jgi:hypothetical protein
MSKSTVGTAWARMTPPNVTFVFFLIGKVECISVREDNQAFKVLHAQNFERHLSKFIS